MKKQKMRYPRKDEKKCFENKTTKIIHKVDNTHGAKFKKGDTTCSCDKSTSGDQCKICFSD